MEVVIGLISGMNTSPNSIFVLCNDEYNETNHYNNSEIMKNNSNKFTNNKALFGRFWKQVPVFCSALGFV